MKQYILTAIALLTMASHATAQTYDFNDATQPLTTVGRGTATIGDGSLHVKDNYVLLGDTALTNYRMTFCARAPKGADQVQIWAGVRVANRYDRYVIGLKGGLLDQIYLLRLGYMGTDEFLGTRPLRFHAVPGEWYKLSVEVVGQRIRVFVGDEPLPYIDVVDKNGQATAKGAVALGGGWIDTEYDDLSITPLAADALNGVSNREYKQQLTARQKEAKRQQEVAAWKPVTVTTLNDTRTDVSLDGQWLFQPQGDERQHVMPVPAFWNPIRIWLHGETMGTPRGHESKGVSDRYYQQETDRCEQYTFDYNKVRSAVYQQVVELPEAIAGKQAVLHFDAVSKACEVYVNDQLAGSHTGMFADFEFDVTHLLHPGRNTITVKVVRNTADDSNAKNNRLDAHYALAQGNAVRDDSADKGDAAQTTAAGTISEAELLRDLPHGFYGNDPAGIWQPVRLTFTNTVKVESAYIKSRTDGADLEVVVKNYSKRRTTIALHTNIVDKKTQSALYDGTSVKNVTLAPGESRTLTYAVDGLQPKLWSPEHPNLYDFRFSAEQASGKKAKTLDQLTVTSGFRTFEVKDGLFYLNGVKYWLRGGNQVPSAICPYDSAVAHRFFQLMREGHIEATRTHTAPFNELWMRAADEEGIGVSFEGTWPWLMLEDRPIPAPELLQLWKDEMLQLIRKYRNHPSLLLWTVNNEMKFYDLDSDTERARKKMVVISDLVKAMRQEDPTRPVVFDSNYFRKGKEKRFGQAFMDSIDDGDVDDIHAYYNWYDFSMFKFFDGEFERMFKLPNRPLISQEMSTGYPNNETGHPTRSYQIIHQNPMTLVGYKGYDFANPRYFLEQQAFTTGELAEALRRTTPHGSGILHFSLLTWFQQPYDAKAIRPWPTYYALSRALQPVLVSAEIWGRHLYGGSLLKTRVYVVNDREDGTDLKPTVLRWQVVDAKGAVLAQGTDDLRAVRHYEHYYIEPTIRMPEVQAKQRVKLLLTLTEDGRQVSANKYALTLAPRLKASTTRRVAVLGDASAIESLGITCRKATTVKELLSKKADVVVIAGEQELTGEEVARLRTYQRKGGQLLLLSCKATAKRLYPEYIKAWIDLTEGDICYMENDDDPVFTGVDDEELRYWNNDRREMPRVCNATLKTVRAPQVDELAGQMKIHAYIDGGKPEDRIRRIEQMRGYTLLRIHDGKGAALVSTLCTDKATTDPIAAQMLMNMLSYK